MKNKQVLLAQRPTGMVKEQDFSIVEAELPTLQEGELLVQNAYISLDPAMRGWMNAGTTYIKGVAIGEVMRAFTVGTVIASKNTNFIVGDAVQGLLGAQTHTITDGKMITKVDTTKVPLSWYLGILGMPGLTAYFGLLDKGQPKEGDIVLVSGAAGMVGSLVGQIAKLKGCTVIGIAGGSEKCDYLKKELGFDFAIDYKKENITSVIKAIAPNGVSIYFDNVGGEILDAALLNLAIGARVVICGAISQYNDATFSGLKNYMKIVSARATLSGIIVLDYFPRAKEAITDIANWIATGKIKYKEHIVDGIENFATTLQMLFTGANKGKLIIKV
jgi:NADPH-dependent curcumin reductase